MTKKLLVFDLDDTLLTTEKTVTDYTAKAIKACKEKGMIVGYITARARPFKDEAFFVDNLPCDFIAYYNGAEICAGDTSIESNVIPNKQAMEIINALGEKYPNTKIAVYMEPWSWSPRSGEAWNMQTGEKIKCSISELPCCNVQRLRVVFDDNDKINLHDYITGETKFFITTDGTAIIINKNAVKERALLRVSEWFNVSLSNVIAFGDDINDIEMIKTAGIGVAMGNAINAVKDVSNYTTETNDKEGISIWINAHLL